MRRAILSFLLTLSPFVTLGQNFGNWSEVNTENSPLMDSSILSLALSNQGNQIWLGTNKGLYLKNKGGWKIFDEIRKDFKPYNVTRIKVDDDGTCRIITGGGFYKYLSNRFYKVPVNFPKSINKSEINDFLVNQENGKVYFGTDNGLLIYDRQNLKTRYITDKDVSFSLNAVYTLAYSENFKGLWISTVNGILNFKNGAWEVYNSFNRPKKRLHVNDLLLTDSGNVWASTKKSGLLKKSKDQKKFQRLSKNRKQKPFYVSIAKNNNGEILVAKAGKKIEVFNEEEEKAKKIRLPQKLYPTTLSLSDNGHVAIGTRKSGGYITQAKRGTSKEKIEKTSNKIKTELYPNPVQTDFVNIGIIAPQNMDVNLRVISQSGKKVYAKNQVSLKRGHNRIKQSLPLSSGVYNITLRMPDGKVLTKRAISVK